MRTFVQILETESMYDADRGTVVNMRLRADRDVRAPVARRLMDLDVEIRGVSVRVENNAQPVFGRDTGMLQGYSPGVRSYEFEYSLGMLPTTNVDRFQSMISDGYIDVEIPTGGDLVIRAGKSEPSSGNIRIKNREPLGRPMIRTEVELVPTSVDEFSFPIRDGLDLAASPEPITNEELKLSIRESFAGLVEKGLITWQAAERTTQRLERGELVTREQLERMAIALRGPAERETLPGLLDLPAEEPTDERPAEHDARRFAAIELPDDE